MKEATKKGQTQAWFKLPKASQTRGTFSRIKSILRDGIESLLVFDIGVSSLFCFPAAPTTASWTTPSNTTGRSFPSFLASTTPWMSSVALTSEWATRSALQWVPRPPQTCVEQAGQHLAYHTSTLEQFWDILFIQTGLWMTFKFLWISQISTLKSCVPILLTSDRRQFQSVLKFQFIP